MSPMNPQDRVTIRQSMEYWAQRMPTITLHHGLETAKKLRKIYPGTDQVDLQIEIINAELAKREKVYIEWLESRQ